VFLECYPHVRGGAQATTTALATGLAPHGWTAEVVAPAGGPAIDAYRSAGVATTVLAAPRALLHFGGDHGTAARATAAAALPRWWLRLRRHLRDVDASLLDVVDQRGIVLGAPATMRTPTRGVWHVHTPGPPSRIDGYGRRWARATIAPSTAAAAGLGPDAAVIPPALPSTMPALRPAFGATAPRLVTAGRLHPVKGLDVLIDAVANLQPRAPGLTLDIYGDVQVGHEAHARSLRAQAQRLGLDDVVHFRGHRPCPWTEWDGAAAYVQPSRDEPFGMALIEAMACGLPVVATRVAGPSEIIEDGRTGLLVEPGDAAALSNAVERIVQDPDLARDLARAGQSHVLAAYTANRLVEQTAAEFERVLA
jgi:glycosyltransferase involved in cell wall biosynthesis